MKIWRYTIHDMEIFCKKGVLRNFAKFTGKHLCQRLFFKKVASCSYRAPPVHLLFIYNKHFSKRIYTQS